MCGQTKVDPLQCYSTKLLYCTLERVGPPRRFFSELAKGENEGAARQSAALHCSTTHTRHARRTDWQISLTGTDSNLLYMYCRSERVTLARKLTLAIAVFPVGTQDMILTVGWVMANGRADNEAQKERSTKEEQCRDDPNMGASLAIALTCPSEKLRCLYGSAFFGLHKVKPL